MKLDAELKKAVDCHLNGDLAAAGAMYDALLKTAPGHAPIWHLAGVLSHQKGDLERACRLISRAVRLTPEDSAYQVSLGAALKANGKLDAAREVFEKAACLAPADADLINELGNIAMAGGDHRQAVEYFRRAVSMAPDSAVFHFNLGLALHHQGRDGQALISYREAVRRDPRLPAAHSAIGNLMQDRGEYRMAIDCYRCAVAITPGDYRAWYNMGHAARSSGDPGTAIECYRKVLTLKPDHAEAHNNLGLIQKEHGNYSDAIRHFESALAHRRNLVEAQYNLGVVEQLRGNHEAGLDCFRKARLIRPDYAPAKWMWHLSLPILYETIEEIDHYRNRFRTNLSDLIENTQLDSPEAVATALEGIGSMTNFYLQYQGRNDRDLQTRYGEFVCRVMAKAYPRWSRLRPMPLRPENSKIRVGYVSSFMRAHTIGEFLAGWLEHHSREDFEFHCYHIGEQTDVMTARFQKYSDAFHQLGNCLEKTAQAILGDRLHILVYTDIGMNPLATQLAALRLAPVQCKGWGHPVTTGLPTIDYYLSSDGMEPENASNHYSECLVKLPNLALAYTPPPLPDPPRSRSDFGLPEKAFLYLNTQSLFKLLPQHDDIYPRIASETDNARFVFLAHKDAEITRKFVKRLSRAFRNHGLTYEDYCHMLPRQDFPDFLCLNMVCDVLLDSIGWSGGKTTLEAISCGLPVVTLPGKTMRGRHAFSMLSIMGIDATVAEDKEDFVRIAAGLCRDREYHAQIRRQIRDKKTKLYADKTCMRALEAFYRRVIRTRTRQPKLIRKDGGAFLVHATDKQYHGVPFWDAVAANLWEAESFGVIRRYCSADKSCIDLGAWIGPTALHAANFARHVYAVEPDRSAAAQFRDNLALNPHLSLKTTLFEGCISNQPGPACIGTRTDFGDSETSMLPGGEAKKDVVPALRFADFLDAYRIDDCGFIKMDIEGAERIVLPDMVDFLRQAGPTLFISLHPHLFGESSELDMHRICTILTTCYHHFYHPSGDRIEALDLSTGTFLEIVAVRRRK